MSAKNTGIALRLEGKKTSETTFKHSIGSICHKKIVETILAQKAPKPQRPLFLLTFFEPFRAFPIQENS